MIVLSLSVCPLSLRGDLTKWLLEIDTGVYVGRLSARVRDELWERICNNTKNGRAIMVYNAQNVQGFEIRTHNTVWSPVEFDGIFLMRHPIRVKNEKVCRTDLHDQKSLNRTILPQKKNEKMSFLNLSQYVVIDIETTGLDPQNDDIIEMAALKVNNGMPEGCFSQLINIGRSIPREIVSLTGITQQMIIEGGESEKVIRSFMDFIGDNVLVSHNASFDFGFINKLCNKKDIKPINNETLDTLALSRKWVHDIPNYRLATIADYFGIEVSEVHRAEKDAVITMRLFEQLKKKVNSEM